MRLMHLIFASLTTAFVLTGCASQQNEPTIETQTVDVVVPTACKTNLYPKPNFADMKAVVRATKDTAAKVQVIMVYLLDQEAWATEAQAVINSCKGN